MYTEEEAEEARQDSVDLLEEGRLLALSRSSIYQQSLRRYYNRKVRPRSFQEGDLVLRLIQRIAGQHKLSAPWEGPFIISKVLGNDSYYLIDTQKPRHAIGPTPAKRQSGHGMQISSEDFTVDAVCTMLPFVLKYQDFGHLSVRRPTPGQLMGPP